MNSSLLLILLSGAMSSWRHFGRRCQHSASGVYVKHGAVQFDCYFYVVAANPHESLRLVADLVEGEPSDTQYDDIKQRLVASHQLSDFQKT
jgi:hypothetical protein